MSQLFATSRRNSMRPLSYNGIIACDCYPQLKSLLVQNRELLARHGMPHADRFLAEPMYDPALGTTDWYTPDCRSLQKASALSPEESQRCQALQQRYSGALQVLLDSLAASPSSQTMEAILRLALKHPSMDNIYLGRDELGQEYLVMADWGMAPGTAEAEPQDIMRRAAGFVAPATGSAAPGAPVPPIPPVPPTQAAQPEQPAAAAPVAAAPALFPGCLSWLLPLFLLLLLLWLLLAALGYAPSPLPGSCFKDPGGLTAAWHKEESRVQTLQQDYKELMAQLEKRAALCPRQPPRPQVPAEPAPMEPAPVLPAIPAVPAVPAEPEGSVDVPFFGADVGLDPSAERPAAPGATGPLGSESEGAGPEGQLPGGENPAAEPDPMPFFGAAPDLSGPEGTDGAGGQESGPVSQNAPEGAPAEPFFGATPPALAQGPEQAGPDGAGSDGAAGNKGPSRQAAPARQGQGAGAQDGMGQAPGLDGAAGSDGAGGQAGSKGQRLQMPASAPKNKDVSFLEGCWRSEDPLYRQGTGEAVVVEYCCDKNGRGRRTHYEKDQQCTGPVQARFRGHSLALESEAISCPRGNGYARQSVECNHSNGKTYCRGTEPGANGKAHYWDAHFVRSR